MKKRIKVFFTDFWPNFIIDNNYFLDLLNPHYDIEISDNNPDFLFFSVFGAKYKRYNCVKIFYTGENVRPDFNQCDYSFTFDYSDDKRNFRLPLYPFFGDITKLLEKPDTNAIMKSKTSFCNFIYSNAGPKKRIEFFKKLSKYKKVDSAGRLLNNMNERVIDKAEFLSRYKFTIAFENESYPGYTTEKIFEPMLVNSLPIYWGNELVYKDFNTESFLNWHDYGSDEALIEKIIELDKDDDKYIEVLNKPFFKNNELNEFVDPVKILSKFDEIFNKQIIPVSEKTGIFKKSPQIQNLYFKYYDLEYKIKQYTELTRKFSFRKAKVKIKKTIEKI